MANEKSGPVIKGASLLGFLKYITNMQGGAELMEKIISNLPEPTRDAMVRKVIAVADYPYSMFVDFIRTADKVAGSGDLSFCRELGRYAAARDVGAYKKTSPNARPRDIFNLADIMWKSYHINSGELKVTDSSPDSCTICITDFPEMDPAHCALMESYFSQTLKELGMEIIEDIREVKCACKGDECHEYRCSWKA